MFELRLKRQDVLRVASEWIILQLLAVSLARTTLLYLNWVSISASNNIKKFLDVDFKKENGFGRNVSFPENTVYTRYFGCEYARAMMNE